jgi:hypothetical protein
MVLRSGNTGKQDPAVPGPHVKLPQFVVSRCWTAEKRRVRSSHLRVTQFPNLHLPLSDVFAC